MPMRPKSTANDLPPRLLRRQKTLASGKLWVGYYYNGRSDDGKRVEIPLGGDLNEAKRKWAQLECKPAPVETGLMKGIFDRYVREVIPTKAPKTQYENHLMLKWLRAVFDSAPIETIRPQHVAQYRDHRGKIANTRANREISLLSHVFNMAREWGHTEKENPCRGVRKNKEKSRDFYADDALWDAVYEHAAPELKRAMDLAYLTGQRPADVRKMRMTDIQGAHLSVQQNKTSKKLLIEINGRLEQLLLQRKKMAVITPQIIVTEDGRPLSPQMLRDRWDKAREDAAQAHPALAARIKLFQFRDIRPKAASEIELEHAQGLLGHTSKRMTMEVYRRAGEKIKPAK